MRIYWLLLSLTYHLNGFKRVRLCFEDILSVGYFVINSNNDLFQFK